MIDQNSEPIRPRFIHAWIFDFRFSIIFSSRKARLFVVDAMATSNKYDRQLRLWGASGQKALSESCIVLINASAAGTESLKNLVLPGIGSFHVLDDVMVPPPTTNGDGSSQMKPFSNFFVFNTSNDPKSRAEIAMTQLSELNPDVKGDFTTVPSLTTFDYSTFFETLLQTKKRILVLAADLPPPILRTVSDLCWSGVGTRPTPIPLVICKSYGMIGSVRVQIPTHEIIESKPSSTISDLRLASAKEHFPALWEAAGAIQWDKLTSQEHGHVPYVLILLKALEDWQSSHKGSLPKTFAEKDEFRKGIKDLARDINNEVNFIEAGENACLAYVINELSWDVQELVDKADQTLADKLKKIGADSVKVFDVLLLALKQFMNENEGGHPPLNGSIPDMTSSTQSYIQLQEMYKTKAEEDKIAMKKLVTDVVKSHDLAISISDEDVSIFCKNVHNIRLIRTRSYASEYDGTYTSFDEQEEIQGDIAGATFDPYEVPEQTPMLWYIALRACEQFYDEVGKYPGSDSRQLALASDATTVQTMIHKVLSRMDLADNDLMKSTLLSKDEGKDGVFATEMVRCHNAEVHNIASVVGGVASQEAVKLITSQYVPMDGTYIFNGIAGVAGVYKF